MKRVFLIAAFLLLLQLPAQAAIAGDVYPTDIKTYLFNEPIRSYNIGGETVIICEDLNWFYDFDVVWNPTERTLRVDDKWKDVYYTPDALDGMRDISQNIKNLPAGYFTQTAPPHVYTTDIKTFFNGEPIRAYNVDGQTAIVCEDLAQFGYTVEWNPAERTLRVGEQRTLTTMAADIGEVIITGKASDYAAACSAVGTKAVQINGAEVTLPALWAYGSRAEYVSLTDALEALQQGYSWDGATLALDALPRFEAIQGMEWGQEGAKALYEVYLTITIGGAEQALSVVGGGSLLTNGKTYEKEAPAYLYDGKIYVPAHFFE